MNKRIQSIDFIKGISIICVILIHSGLIHKYKYYYLIDAITRIGVPSFFVISGYFLSKNIDNTTYTIKYILKLIIIHLITWSIFYILLKNLALPFTKNNLLWYGLVFHLWFLSALILNIFILFIANKLHFTKIIFFISCILFFIALFGLNENYFDLFHIKITIFTRNGIYFGLLFMSLGNMIYLKKIKIDYSTNIIVCFILFFSFTSMLEKHIGLKVLNANIGSDFFISTPFLVFFIFCLCFQYKNINIRMINNFGKNSLIIYLFHPMVIFHLQQKYNPNLVFILTFLFFNLLILILNNYKIFAKNNL